MHMFLFSIIHRSVWICIYLLHAHAPMSAFEGKVFHYKLFTFAAVLFNPF